MKPIKMHPEPESQKQTSLGEQDSIPGPEVPEKKPRRRFTDSYKLLILQEVENRTEPGGVGKILRREGLFNMLYLYLGLRRSFPKVELIICNQNKWSM